MDVKQRYIASSIFLTLVFSIHAQSIRELVKDERKRSILENVKPSHIISRPISKQTEIKSQTFDNDPDTERRAKYGIDQFTEVKNLEVSPYLLDIPKEQILKIEHGTATKTFLVNGKFMTIPVNYEHEQRLDQMSQRHRLQGLMITTGAMGVNLSGYKKKKISKKAKNILENVFGMKVEE